MFALRLQLLDGAPGAGSVQREMKRDLRDDRRRHSALQLWVVLVAIGALVFANLDAALPGLDAARTPAALTLRAE
jgi:hypothetical protein